MQKIQAFDKRYQFLLFAAEPYEIIAFKVNLIAVCVFKREGRFVIWK